MKLSDNSIVNSTIKFLSPVRAILDKQGDIAGAYFIFNMHKLYYNTLEEAETIRNEIIEKVPEYVVPVLQTGPTNTNFLEEPPIELET